MMMQNTLMRLEGVYDRFDAAWANGSVPQIDDFLPVGLPPHERQEVLLELVLIDLEHRWQRFPLSEEVPLENGAERATVGESGIPRRPLVEDYCCRYPELGDAKLITSELIAQEYRTRCRAGDGPRIDEYLQRFPNRSTELPKLLTSSGSSREMESLDAVPLHPRRAASGGESDSAVMKSAPTPRFDDRIEISVLRYPVPELADGRVFGRYRIERVLGRGGMGTVYRAHDSHLHRTVALKVPLFKQGYSEEVVKRFLREARAVAQLSHANLCRVFDVGVIDGTLFLTMEFVEGQSLDELFQLGEVMPDADIVLVIRQVALALQEAHERGIIHRDLKPANIMLNAKGQPVLMDFGLARSIDRAESDLTKEGALLGTPAYMSPEQVRGASHEISPATDIYGLGVVMYRLLTGRRPFEGTFISVLAAISTETPAAPRDLCKTIHPTIEAICLKAMAKNPTDRFKSAAEMAEALDQALPTPLITSTGKQTELKDETTQPIRKLAASDRLCQDTDADTSGPKKNVRAIGGVVAVAAVILIAAWLNRGASLPSSPDTSNSQPPVTPTVSSFIAKQVPPVANSNIATEKLIGKPLTADPILETQLQRAQQQQDYEVLSQTSLPLREKDKLHFHVTLNAPSYVYLYLIDTKGKPVRLWPKTSEDLKQQQPVRELWSPPLAGEGQKQEMYFLDELHGQETVLVATSQRPLSQADLQTVETVRLNLKHREGGPLQLVSFRRENRERGFGGIIETDKALSVELDSFTERLNRVFDGYTGIVFPHE